MPKLTPRAKKQLDNLPVQLAAKAHLLIRRLDDGPHIGKKLVGRLRGKRSERLGRTHRVIYTVTERQVVALTIRARKDVYR